MLESVRPAPMLCSQMTVGDFRSGLNYSKLNNYALNEKIKENKNELIKTCKNKFGKFWDGFDFQMKRIYKKKICKKFFFAKFAIKSYFKKLVFSKKYYAFFEIVNRN